MIKELKSGSERAKAFKKLGYNVIIVNENYVAEMENLNMILGAVGKSTKK